MSQLAPPTAFDGCRAVAHDLAVALAILVTNPSPPPLACSILAGQATESFLKAILLRAGKTEGELKAHPIRHDLDELWVQAALAEPSLGRLPGWVPVLARNWKPKFRLRYPSDIHGLVLPNLVEMAEDLKRLVKSHL